MANNKAHDEWKREHMTRLSWDVRKDDPIIERMAEAVRTGRAPSRQGLIRQAVEEWLEKHEF